jgi:hypothetical protein
VRRWHGLAFNKKRGVPTAPFKRDARCHLGGLNSWQRPQFFQQALIKRDDPLWCGILPLRQTDLKAQDTLKAKSGLDLLQLTKTPQKQSGSDE